MSASAEMAAGDGDTVEDWATDLWPILQHGLLSLYAQFIVVKTNHEPPSDKQMKILEIIARMVPEATKQEEKESSYTDTANRVSQLQSQILKNGEVGKSQEEELAKLIGCSIFSRSDKESTKNVRFMQAMGDAAEGVRTAIKNVVQDEAKITECLWMYKLLQEGFGTLGTLPANPGTYT